MKEVHKTLAVLVYWTIVAVAYGSAECIHGDIRLRDEHGPVTTTAGGVEVCVFGSWTTVCHTGGWHSRTLNRTENTRVACRQLGYREEGATFIHTIKSAPRTATGLRQGQCSGSELQLIDCPAFGSAEECADGVRLTCQPAICSTTIRLRGGSTDTAGRVEVCRDGQWGTVCDDSWDSNDASVACRQLGLSDLIAVPLPSAYFGPGSVSIHLSNLQCNGNEAALTDCIINTEHQCPHNQDASVICLTSNIPSTIIDNKECTSENATIVYNSEQAIVIRCQNQELSVCNNECQAKTGVSQLGAYFCESGEVYHFLISGSQLYECPISGAGEFLTCEPTVINLSANCEAVWRDFVLIADSTSVTVMWDNSQFFENNIVYGRYEITCSPDASNLQFSIVLNSNASEVTVDNLPHSTTYECCVTFHIARYSTRACGNTATLADTTRTESGGATIALGVLVAVLVLLLVLVTGACLYLLIMRVKSNGKYGSPSSTNQPQEHHLENPEYTTHSNTNTDPPTPAAPPHTLTPPPLLSEGTELTEFDSTYSAVDTPDLTYDIPGERPAMKTWNTAMKPIKEAPLPAREEDTEERLEGSGYSALDKPQLVYAVVDKKAKKKKKKKQVKIAQRYEVPQESPSCQEEYSRLQHGKN